MNVVKKLFRLIGLAPKFTHDDILNAENENDLFDHGKAVQAAGFAITNRKQSTEKLRTLLEAHIARSEEFAQFEERLKREAKNVRSGA